MEIWLYAVRDISGWEIVNEWVVDVGEVGLDGVEGRIIG